jgi:aconitate decarboxylase
MSLAYAVAVTLLDGTALAAQFAPERIDADDVWRLIDRTTTHHEAAFDERYEDGYCTRLNIELTSGRVLSAFVQHPRGGIRHPLTNEEIVEKFRALIEPLAGAARADEIEQAMIGIESLESVDELAALLASPVEPLFAPKEAVR